MSAIQADYRTTKHIPSRKCYQLILEVPEEEFPEVCKVLGYPKTGENTYVGIALLDKSVIKEFLTTEQIEGEKLRTRAIMLCKDDLFYKYIGTLPTKIGDSQTGYAWTEGGARVAIYDYCNIKSRSELTTNKDAQQTFRILLGNFKAWQTTNQYADNLSRE